MEAVYILQSGQKLNKSKFCKYIYRKFEKTSKNLGIKFRLKRENNAYCLDDAAIDAIYGLMTGKKAKTKAKKSPFVFCLRKELEIYSKIKGIKFKFIEYNGLKLKIKEMLDLLEEKHREIKYSILKAFFQMGK